MTQKVTKITKKFASYSLLWHEGSAIKIDNFYFLSTLKGLDPSYRFHVGAFGKTQDQRPYGRISTVLTIAQTQTVEAERLKSHKEDKSRSFSGGQVSFHQNLFSH
jgi:hypothetical protein